MINELAGLVIAHHAATALLLFYLSQIHSASLFEEIIILGSALGHALRVTGGMLEVLGVGSLLSTPLGLKVLRHSLVVGVI